MSGAKFICIASLMISGQITALTCPVCNSETGKQVRASLFGQEFGNTFLMVAAPFPILGMVVGIAYWLPPFLPRNHKPEGGTHESEHCV